MEIHCCCCCCCCVVSLFSIFNFFDGRWFVCLLLFSLSLTKSLVFLPLFVLLVVVFMILVLLPLPPPPFLQTMWAWARDRSTWSGYARMNDSSSALDRSPANSNERGSTSIAPCAQPSATRHFYSSSSSSSSFFLFLFVPLFERKIRKRPRLFLRFVIKKKCQARSKQTREKEREACQIRTENL